MYSETKALNHTTFKSILLYPNENKAKHFSHTDVLFSPVQNACLLIRFRLSSTLKRPKTPINTTVDLLFLRHFQNAPFSPIHTKIGASSQRRVFKRLHFWDRFRKSSFSSVFSVILALTITKNASKRMRLHTKTHKCGRGRTEVLSLASAQLEKPPAWYYQFHIMLSFYTEKAAGLGRFQLPF